MSKLIVATKNEGKFREVFHYLKSHFPDLACESLLDKQSLEILEDRDTFLGNATKKAQEVAKIFQSLTLADDSGIEVDALNGAPGVFSARFAGPNAKDVDNNEKLIASLKNIPIEKRTARYRCVMVLCSPEGEVDHTEGTVEGMILDDPRGLGGFGYDPHFFLPDRNLTMAEIPLEEKNRISHRARALQEMIPLLQRALRTSSQC